MYSGSCTLKLNSSSPVISKKCLPTIIGPKLWQSSLYQLEQSYSYHLVPQTLLFE